MQLQLSGQWLFAIGVGLFLIYQVDAYVDARLAESSKHISRQLNLDGIQLYLLPVYVAISDISVVVMVSDISWFRIVLLMILIVCTWGYYASLPYFKKNKSLKNCFSAMILVSGLPLISNFAYININLNHYIYAGLFFLVIWLNFEWIDILYQTTYRVEFVFKVLVILSILFLAGYHLSNPIVYTFLPIFAFYLYYPFSKASPRIKELVGDVLHILPFIVVILK